MLVFRHRMKHKKAFTTKKNRLNFSRQTAMFASIMLIIGMIAGVPIVRADTLQEQISRLQQENSNNQNIVASLQSQAVSYEDAINQLQAQISQLQGKIDENTSLQTSLQNQIVAAQAELDQQKKVLGENIKAMYLEGDISTIEMLATSKDLSDYFDKQQYREVVRAKIKNTLDKITVLKAQLKDQKEAVERLLKSQQEQQTQLASARSEQNNLLAYNQQQQSDYNQRTKNNQSRINDLIAQQRRLNDSNASFYFLRFPGAVNSHNTAVDDYPYRDAGFSMQLGPCSNSDGWPDSPDQWGYCTRQCVSYTAWAVQRSGRDAPRYYGNAKDWVTAAYNSNIPVYTSNPQPGDVAISTAGAWGHAMYVEAVNGNQILVSQYNQQLTGAYSTQWRTYQ